MRKILSWGWLAGMAVMLTGCAMFSGNGPEHAMKQMTNACLQYAQDHGRMPPERPADLKPDYLPADFDAVHYKITLSEPLQFQRPGDVILVCNTQSPSEGRRIVGYVDGQVETIREYSALKPMAALTLGCIIYAGRYKKLPARLEDLKLAGCIAPHFNLTPYELLLHGSLNTLKDPANTMLLRERLASEDHRRVVAFADGHLELARE